jgi:hypothetical protein
MRFFLLGFIMTHLIILNGYTQDYERLVESNKEFLIRETIYSTDVPMMEIKRIGFIKYHKRVKYPIVSWSKILFSRDTIINNQKYLSIIKTSAYHIDSGSFIMEDSKKVYFIDNSKMAYELYDYNVKVGDTVKHILGFNPVDLICNKIDTLINQGYKRERKLFIQCCFEGDNAIWVDGLGNMKGIIYHHYDFPCCCGCKLIKHDIGGGYSDSKLIRVKKDSKIIYLDTEYGNFDFDKIKFKRK